MKSFSELFLDKYVLSISIITSMEFGIGSGSCKPTYKILVDHFNGVFVDEDEVNKIVSAAENMSEDEALPVALRLHFLINDNIPSHYHSVFPYLCEAPSKILASIDRKKITEAVQNVQSTTQAPKRKM